VASIYTHLAIAKLYLEKNEVKDTHAFCDGSVMPDVTSEKENSHYGNRGETKDLIKRHKEKIGLAEFLQANPDDTDFNRGRFLHLLTDYKYYNELMPNDYLKTIDFPTWTRDLFYTIKYHEKYLIEKYNLSFDMTSMKDKLTNILAGWEKRDLEKYGPNGPQGVLLHTREELENFIQELGNANLKNLTGRYL